MHTYPASMIIVASLLACVFCDVPIPSQTQLEWMDLEVGAMITWNLQSYCMEESDPRRSSQACQKLGYVPSLQATAEWDPYALDTDQWVEAAVSFGAKYIVLVADHMTGFTLWDTKTHNFSISHTKWKGGGGDVVSDFIASCAKYNAKAGFFYSTHYNWYLGVNNYEVGWPPLGGKAYTQEQYDAIAAQQLQELYSYAGAYEVWFDGGVDTLLTPTVPKVVASLVPNALCHSCVNFTRNVGLRWMGNEDGVMPLPSWGASNGSTTGSPTAASFMPPSSDTVLREHYWFWWNNTEHTIKTTTQLLNTYLTSVGRASNLILNIAPDSTGAVPQADLVAYSKFGVAVKCLFSTKVFDVNITQAASVYTFTVPVVTANMSVTVQEDQTAGQVVNQWEVSVGGYNASEVGIGRQRIVNVLPKAAPDGEVVVRILSTVGNAVPKLRRVILHDWVGKEACVN